MTWEQILVLVVFICTIGGLALTNKRPSSVFAVSMLLLLLAQQISLEEILKNVTNTGLVTLVLLLLLSHSIDKTAFIKRLGRAIVRKSFTQSFWRMFAVTFTSSALLNNTAIVASLIGPIKQNQLHAPSR